jgi:hypothetical protein
MLCTEGSKGKREKETESDRIVLVLVKLITQNSTPGKASQVVNLCTCTTARHTLVTQTFYLSCKKITFLMCEFFTCMYYEATRILLLYLKPQEYRRELHVRLIVQVPPVPVPPGSKSSNCGIGSL